MYSENWTGVQTRIFLVWKSQTAAGRGGRGRCWKHWKAADTIKETTSALASCWKAILQARGSMVRPCGTLWDKERTPPQDRYARLAERARIRSS